MALVYLFIFVILIVLYKVLHLNQTPEKPKVHGWDVRFVDYIVKSCPILLDGYIPTALWGKSGHIQTIVHSVIGRVHVPRSEGERIFVDTNDGSLLSFDIHTPYNQHHSEADLTMAICPGIGNSSETVYIQAFIHNALRKGYRCVVLNHLGTLASVPLKTPRIFSYGGTEELEIMVREVLRRFPETKVICLGFSMGGNIMTRFMASAFNNPDPNAEGDAPSDSRRVVGGISICQGYDALVTSDCLAQWENLRRVYVYFMTCGMKNLINRHKDILLDEEPKKKFNLDPEQINAASSLKEFDEAYSRRIFGFDNVEEMYRSFSSVHVLKNIKKPMVFINAADDPLVPEVLLAKIRHHAETSDKCVYLETLHGGHLAFFEGGLLIPRKHGWLDRAAIQLADSLATYTGAIPVSSLPHSPVPVRRILSPGDIPQSGNDNDALRAPAAARALSLKELSSLAC